MTNPTTITAQPGEQVIDIVREFDATVPQLFRAMTEPEFIVQWLSPCRFEIRLDGYDARTGGSYRYVHVDQDGSEYGFHGVFHSVVPNETIIQTFEFEGAPGHVSLETATYAEVDGRAHLHTRSVYPSVEARDAAVASGMEYGIAECMERLDELFARERANV
jgi:uncharacterized protein YndB with AHSA1/START domain